MVVTAEKKRSAIERELTKATGLKRKDGEKDAAFGTRLLKALSKLPEDEFDALSEEAQAWNNTSVKLAKKEKPPAPFDAEADEEEEEEEADEEEADEEEESEDDESDDEEEEEEDEAPKAKKGKGKSKPAADDDEEEADEEDEEEEEEPPAKSKGKKGKAAPADDDEEDEEESDDDSDDDEDEVTKKETRKRKKAQLADGTKTDQHSAFRELVVSNLGLDNAKIRKMAEKRGIELAAGSMNSTLYHIRHAAVAIAKIHGLDIPGLDVEQPKAKRGRPKGSGKKAKKEDADDDE